jgi:hypothetical protein
MKVETVVSSQTPAKDFAKKGLKDASIVFYFLSPNYPKKDDYLAALKAAYPAARLVGCTTGGEIAEDEALDKSAVSAAVALKKSTIRVAKAEVTNIAESHGAGKNLAAQLDAPDLKLIFVLSDGLMVNGSELVRGIIEGSHKDVIVTGGLAGDGPNFKKTGVGIDGLPQSGIVAAVGFYGDNMRISYGSVGGWSIFGPERLITRAKDNVLYELDGKPALALYKQYLGEEAEKLPGSGLLYPLSIRPANDTTHSIVRTIVGIDEKEKSLIFAGDMPVGHIAQLMHGSHDNLVDGAEKAAEYALRDFGKVDPKHTLGILVSCIGRNLMMGQRVSSEVEAVHRVLNNAPLVGFYSYGEICHHPQTKKCDLHNQTMTITLLSESA